MKNIYQHFRKEEQEFIDSAVDWVRKVEEQYAPFLTTFLDPRQQYILKAIAGQYSEISLHFYGGYEDAERKRVFISPSYFQPNKKEFEIALVDIRYPTKFAELSHGQILGSILGSGIKRETLGDIISDGENWQFFVDETFFPYILTQIEKVGRTKVSLEQRSLDERIQTQEKWEIKTEIVSSMRLDVVLSGVYNLSRGKAKELISSKRVKVNWTQTERADSELDMQDIVSIRGFGRMQIREIQGRTKKDKLLLEIGVLDST